MSTTKKLLTMLIVVALTLGASAVAFAGSSDDGEAPSTHATTDLPKSPRGYVEAPMLTEMVAAGEIEPLDERLPVNPLVIETGTILPADVLDVEVGQYTEEFIEARINEFVYHEPLMNRPNFTATLTPNIIEEWDISSDLSTFTFTIRDGIRWSDGVLVTTEDVRFAWEDVQLNQQITPSVNSLFVAGGKTAELDIIDDLTFEIEFVVPNPEFLLSLNYFIQSYSNLIKPSHYLRQFHADYADSDELAALVAEANLRAGEWYTLFSRRDIGREEFHIADTIGTPVLSPWYCTLSESDQIVLERNPYYFAVDADGKQLPYFDRVLSLNVGSGAEANETGNLMLIDRQIDYAWGGGAGSTSLPFMLENQANGNFTAFDYATAATYQIYPNPTYDDPTWRLVLNDPRFRQALNHALDKEDINDVVLLGRGSIPRSIEAYYYDPDLANELLDEMGMDRRDSDGFRLAPNGEPFEMFVEIHSVPVFVQDMEIVTPNWEAVGIRTNFRQSNWEQLGEKGNANELTATIRWSREPYWDFRLEHDYLPSAWWAPLWQQWYESDGERGEQPPDYVMDLYELHEEIMVTVPGTTRDAELYNQLYAWFEEHVPWFMMYKGAGITHYLNNRIGNRPSEAVQHHGSWQARKIQFADGSR